MVTNIHPHPRQQRATELQDLPEDPSFLLRYFRMADELLALLANSIEPNWDLAEHARAETERLHHLQEAIVAKLVRQPAVEASDVMLKLDLWRCLRGLTADTLPARPEDSIVLSVIRDLERLFATDPSRGRDA